MDLFPAFLRARCATILLAAGLMAGSPPAAAVSRIALAPTGFAASGDEAGRTVDLSGDTVAVGAPRMQVVPAAYSGAVEIFRWNNGNWQSEALVLPNAPGIGHQFGSRVAIEGDTLVVGAAGCCAVSTVYTFQRTGTTWNQVDQFPLPSGITADFALSGDTLLVTGGLVFIREGLGWALQAQLTGDEPQFTGGVAIDGDRSVLGSSDFAGGEFGPLYAYVFVRSGASWSREAKFQIGGGNGVTFPKYRFALSGDALLSRTFNTVNAWIRQGGIWVGDGTLDPVAPGAPEFGEAIDLQDDRAAVGSPGTTGSVFVFERANGGWVRVARAFDPTPSSYGGELGASVAMHGDTIVAGAPEAETTAGSSGKAIVFDRGDGSWPRTADLKQGSALKDLRFGWSVARSATTLAASAPWYPSGVSSSVRGAVFVFEKLGGSWTQKAELRSAANRYSQDFGKALAVQGDTIIVGAERESEETFPGSGIWLSGAVYVFERQMDGAWLQQSRILAPSESSFFGASTALSPNDLAIGETRGTSPSHPRGRIHMFERAGNSWTPGAVLSASDLAAGDGFGSASAISGDTLIVGAPGMRRGPETNVGAAYVFQRTGGVWTEQARLLGPTLLSLVEFGRAVALAGDTAVVAQGPGPNIASPQNRVLVFSRSGEDWTLSTTLLPPVSTEVDFGQAVSISADESRLIVGSPAAKGSTHMYVRDGQEWTRTSTWMSGDMTSSSDCFGHATAISGEEIAVGAPCEGDLTGAAYTMSIADTLLVNGFD